MEGRHVAIAAFLRTQRPASAGAIPEPPMPHVHTERMFACRFCADRVQEGEHGEMFHFNELWEAVSCAVCHRERLRLEAQAERGALLHQAWHRAVVVRPRCKRCGEIIGDGGATGYDIEELRAKRTCADCYMPF